MRPTTRRAKTRWLRTAAAPLTTATVAVDRSQCAPSSELTTTQAGVLAHCRAAHGPLFAQDIARDLRLSQRSVADAAGVLRKLGLLACERPYGSTRNAWVAVGGDEQG